MKTCIIYECDKPRNGRGLCYTHYRKAREQGIFPAKKCRDCEAPVYARELCRKHYRSGASLGAKRQSAGWVDENGYRCLSLNGRTVKEHRVILEEKLGRALLPGENVHHINGVRTDNRPENLELWCVSQPAGQRPDQLADWAEEILTRYRPSSLRKE